MAPIVVVRYRKWLWLFTSLYLMLLITTWVLTCLQARRPFLLVRRAAGAQYDLEKHGIRQKEADLATRFSYALDGLSYVAAILALPVISAVLARAAVVYSMRTNTNKKLNLRKLFALADRRFVSTGLLLSHQAHTLFAFLGALLILVAFVQPIVRATTVDIAWNQFVQASYSGSADIIPAGWPNTYGPSNGWAMQVVGASPDVDTVRAAVGPRVVERTRNAIIGSQNLAKTNRDFQTSVPQGIDTGLLRQVALRLDTESDCYKMSDLEYPSICRGAEFPYRTQNMTIDVCVTGPGIGWQTYYSPWNASYASWARNMQVVREEIYVRAVGKDYYDEWAPVSMFRCWANTTLSYFELPGALNNQTAGDRIVDYSDYLRNASTGDVSMLSLSKREETSAETSAREIEERQAFDYDWQVRETSAPGPLMTTALALFGRGSFYALAQKVGNTTKADDSSLSESCPYPFKLWVNWGANCMLGRGQLANSWWANSAVGQMVAYIGKAPSDFTYYSSDIDKPGPMKSALFAANQAILNEAEGKITINRPKTLPFRQFVISQPALIAGTALVGLQALGIMVFLWYAYRVPTWTDTLDSLAIARITHQLKDDGLLRDIGLRETTPDERKMLESIDGLIGLEEPPIPLEDMSSTAAATTAAASSLVSGSSSTSHVDTLSHHSHHSHHSQPPAVRVDDPSMGMSSIPIDAQTFGSEDSDDERHPNNTNTNTSPDINPNSSSNQNNHNAATNTLLPRISLDVGEETLDPNNHDFDHEGRNSPPAYTPRTAEDALEPPPYATALSVNELRVGAQGLVTKRLPRTRDNVWV